MYERVPKAVECLAWIVDSCILLLAAPQTCEGRAATRGQSRKAWPNILVWPKSLSLDSSRKADLLQHWVNRSTAPRARRLNVANAVGPHDETQHGVAIFDILRFEADDFRRAHARIECDERYPKEVVERGIGFARFD